MAWIENRKSKDGTIRRYVRDRIDGKKVVVVKNAGRWRDIADARRLDYLKKKAMGDAADLLPKKRLPIEEMCDLHFDRYGPTLKGGISDHYKSPYHNYSLWMGKLKRTWAGRFADEISEIDMAGFLAQVKVGTRMRWIGIIGRIFKNMESWNKRGILPALYQLPAENPASKYRETLKPAEKRERPDTRVLTPEEWGNLCEHLTPRAMAISELALHRCLRLADIRAITHLSIVDKHIQGLQAKTGESFKIPMLSGQPAQYNFRNFRKDFEKAQILAGLNYPADHPLHFSPKDLRRTGATWAYRKTKDLVGVQKLLGHRSSRTTELYLNLDSADIRKVTDAIDSAFPRSGQKWAPGGQNLESKIKGKY